QTGSINELLAAFSYNGQHLPLTATDASGQQTIFTYNDRGQLKTIENALHQSTTLNYDTNGYLQNIVGHTAQDVTAFAYDGFGRVHTVTDSEGYAVTTDYDNLDRPITITYPNGTFEELVWNRLDLVAVKDRNGRWTNYFYDANRRLGAVN